MKKILAFASVFLLLSALPASATTLVINTPKVEREVAPGQSASGEITIENPTTKEMPIRIYLEDFEYNPGSSGDKTFTPAGTLPTSLAKSLTFTPAEAVVPPFGRTTLRYSLQLPADAVGGYYSVIFFETVVARMPNEEGVMVDVAGRVGSLFLIEAQGSQRREGKITSVEVKPAEGNKPLEIVTAFQNTGNVHVALGGNFVIMDEAGAVAARGELAKLYTMPGDSATGATKWIGRLPKGTYTVLLTYSLGKGKSLVEEKPLVVG